MRNPFDDIEDLADEPEPQPQRSEGRPAPTRDYQYIAHQLQEQVDALTKDRDRLQHKSEELQKQLNGGNIAFDQRSIGLVTMAVFPALQALVHNDTDSFPHADDIMGYSTQVQTKRAQQLVSTLTTSINAADGTRSFAKEMLPRSLIEIALRILAERPTLWTSNPKLLAVLQAICPRIRLSDMQQDVVDLYSGKPDTHSVPHATVSRPDLSTLMDPSAVTLQLQETKAKDARENWAHILSPMLSATIAEAIGNMLVKHLQVCRSNGKKLNQASHVLEDGYTIAIAHTTAAPLRLPQEDRMVVSKKSATLAADFQHMATLRMHMPRPPHMDRFAHDERTLLEEMDMTGSVMLYPAEDVIQGDNVEMELNYEATITGRDDFMVSTVLLQQLTVNTAGSRPIY